MKGRQQPRQNDPLKKYDVQSIGYLKIELLWFANKYSINSESSELKFPAIIAVILLAILPGWVLY